MPRGQHRAEPVRRPLVSVARELPRPVVAAAVGLLLAGVAAGTVLWARGDAGTVTTVVADQRDGALAANALRAAAALRVEERTSRDRSGLAAPVTPSATPTTVALPAVVGKQWATKAIVVRSGPAAADDKVGSVKAGDRIGVTGVTFDGWSQVVLAGKVGWVPSASLATTKPAAVTAKAVKLAAGLSNAPCPKSASIEVHLTANARAVYRSVCAAYGSSVKSFGGYRAGDPGDHGSGRAVDIMVSGDPGWTIARYVQAHASALNVTYVIYQQHIWLVGHPTSEWKLMEDRGSVTANHYDHVHVSVE